MKRSGVILALAAVFTFMASPAAPDDDMSVTAKVHTCTEKDILGTFVLMSLDEAPPGPEMKSFTHFSHQYLAFYTRGLYANMDTNRAINTPDALEKIFVPQRNAGNQKYTLADDGVLNMYSNHQGNYSYRCVTTPSDGAGYKKGDLILTGYSKGTTTQFTKVYRRWY